MATEKPEFIYCPRCGSSELTETDYEIEVTDGDHEVDDDGRACDECGWEGDVSELVCKDDDATAA